MEGLKPITWLMASVFSRDVVLGGRLLLWGEKMWRISKKQTKFVIVWGGNSKLRGEISPLKALKKTLLMACHTLANWAHVIQQLIGWVRVLEAELPWLKQNRYQAGMFDEEGAVSAKLKVQLSYKHAPHPAVRRKGYSVVRQVAMQHNIGVCVCVCVCMWGGGSRASPLFSPLSNM